MTAKAVQVRLGVDQPDFGALFDDMLIEDGGMLDPARVLQPKAEAEIALVLAKDIFASDATAANVTAAALHAGAAIEKVDSRISDWKISFADTVADNGSSAFFVLGWGLTDHSQNSTVAACARAEKKTAGQRS
ncbi:hypothetical protein HRJ34_17860 [Rhizorhabdus wittichii]|uniref:Uncharacterized protein n=1 Tax=Rhizorhabdus wittichii TaxID=160791 RepID=A0A975CYS9_9SPHN|nr:hypothetical protein [Rhizorhabdus wittichii]QTH20210.1 hypothetical protein HRJ34_17860 [Rhizorhabdus wittichii]